MPLSDLSCRNLFFYSSGKREWIFSRCSPLTVKAGKEFSAAGEVLRCRSHSNVQKSGWIPGPPDNGATVEMKLFHTARAGQREGPGGALTAHVIPPLSAFIFQSHRDISAWRRQDGDVHWHTHTDTQTQAWLECQHLSWYPHHNPIEICWCGTPPPKKTDYVFLAFKACRHIHIQ